MMSNGAREANEELDHRTVVAKLKDIERKVGALVKSGEDESGRAIVAEMGMAIVRTWLRERLRASTASLIEPAAELYARLRELKLIEESPLAPSHGYDAESHIGFEIERLFYISGRGPVLVGDVVHGRPEDLRPGMTLFFEDQELEITGVEGAIGMGGMKERVGLLIRLPKDVPWRKDSLKGIISKVYYLRK